MNEQDQTYQSSTTGDEAYTQVQILDKRIEPDKTPRRDKVNRNIVMGNIDKKLHQQFSNENRYSRMIHDVPTEYGGWFLHGFANMNVENIEFDVSLSRSVDGFNQKQLNTTNQNQSIRDETQQSGFINMFKRKRRDT